MSNKNNILYINTRDNKKIIVKLEVNGKKDSLVKTTDSWTSQLLLLVVDELLKRNKISLSQITEINVEKGPGSFTGLRIGAAVGNTLGWLLGIPVNGKKGKLAEPVYQ
jgi:tRNA threonylcarbamoyladenosine biosynthesis protein TsaB